ncbi:MAG: VOC family protein, partial [Chloroflexi bacterium]|nr:VOC family protein [Chloroflexota bacterium]
MKKLNIASQITFLYYRDLVAAQQFYEEILGLEIVEDQGWAKIYRVNGTAFVGLVDEAHGSLKAQPENAVMITFVVDDVRGWYDHLRENGVTIRQEYGRFDSIQIECFFAQDPGGYELEFQRFLKPELTAV